MAGMREEMAERLGVSEAAAQAFLVRFCDASQNARRRLATIHDLLSTIPYARSTVLLSTTYYLPDFLSSPPPRSLQEEADGGRKARAPSFRSDTTGDRLKVLSTVYYPLPLSTIYCLLSTYYLLPT